MSQPRVELRSDNAAPVAPQVMDAIRAANTGTAPAYGDDDITNQLTETVREVFEHDSARVFVVTSGTAANALGLSAMCPPWGAVVCHDTAHIRTHEAGATSLLAGGAQLVPLGGQDHQVSPERLRAALASTWWGDPHVSQPTVLSLTQPTDFGSVYTADQIASLASIAAEHGMRTHVDGARVANALVHLAVSPADVTWRAGVSALTLGATKNGAMSADAIVVFDDDIADELVFRTKRAGHVTSKMRYQSAQLQAWLTDDLWLALAATSNKRMAQLIEGLDDTGITVTNRVDANMAFLDLAPEVATRARAAGVLFHTMGRLARVVTNWATTKAEVETAVHAFTAAVQDC